mmetsp:Transcript_3642/g.10934  ORF Transcript_3642/g.10934 Transcript_3642/m.10934 type:complete len:230 (-) Transcript_3642:140-829(-)
MERRPADVEEERESEEEGGGEGGRSSEGDGDGDGDQEKFYEPMDHVLHRPWLILAASFASTWGHLRWPCRGLPCTMVALSDYVVVSVVKVSSLLEKGKSTESFDAWFTDEGKSTEGNDLTIDDHFETFYLSKGQSLSLPFGVFAQWAFFPAHGNVEKPEKATKGRLMVQWALPKQLEPAPPSPVFKEVRHMISKVLDQHGKNKPWADLKDPLLAWFSAVEPPTPAAVVT